MVIDWDGTVGGIALQKGSRREGGRRRRRDARNARDFTAAFVFVFAGLERLCTPGEATGACESERREAALAFPTVWW
jgi:hypothetical protein